MKILAYKDSLAVGRGADRAVKNFALRLGERGHDVRLIEKSALRESLNERFDVIVATGSNEAIDLDRLGYFERPDRAKTILQLHLAPRGFFKWKHPLRNRRIRRAFDKFDAVQVLCSSYVDEFKRLAPHPHVVTIGNFSDFPVRLTPTSLTRASQTILYPAATLSHDKRQLLLIRAFALLSREFPSWRVRLLGKATTKYAESCRREIARLGVGAQVEIVGFTDDLAGEYSRAAFLAFPSRLEGFPLAILEAAKYALPTLAAADLPGVVDIVENGESGLIVPRTIHDFAEGLRKLMTDVAYRESLGAASRDSCAARYSREKILDQWDELLVSVKFLKEVR